MRAILSIVYHKVWFGEKVESKSTMNRQETTERTKALSTITYWVKDRLS